MRPGLFSWNADERAAILVLVLKHRWGKGKLVYDESPSRFYAAWAFLR